MITYMYMLFVTNTSQLKNKQQQDQQA